MKDKNTFNILMKISLGLYVLILFFAIMLKAIMPKDLIANYQFLSFMNVNERLIRGLKIVEFYQIEAEIGELTKAIILDFFNMIIFIPFGILLAHCFKKNKILKTLLVSFVFIVLIIDVFPQFSNSQPNIKAKHTISHKNHVYFAFHNDPIDENKNGHSKHKLCS